jgi:hypothetical protein
MVQFSSMSIMRRTMLSALAGVLAVRMVPQAASAQADPFIGTWKLNSTKSTYSGQQPWKSSTQTVQPAAQGLLFTEEIVNANGRAGRTVLPLIYDGQPHPVIEGGANSDSVIIRRIDASTQEWTFFMNGQPGLSGRIVFSSDGRTATWTVAGKNAQGQAINRTRVYEKQ